MIDGIYYCLEELDKSEYYKFEANNGIYYDVCLDYSGGDGWRDGNKFSYRQIGDMLYLVDCFDDEKKWQIYKEYIFLPDRMMRGEIPDETRFETVCYEGIMKIKFFLDGTAQVIIEDDYKEEPMIFKGKYSRKDELLSIMYDGGSEEIFLIYENKLTSTGRLKAEFFSRVENKRLHHKNKEDIDCNEILVLNRIEKKIEEEFIAFEKRVMQKWALLPNLDKDTIYNICPYFSDKDFFFQHGIQNIMNAILQLSREQEDTLKIKFDEYMKILFAGWDAKYIGQIDDFFYTYSEAFEAVTANSEQKMRDMRKKLESKTNSSLGYITNDMSALLLYETSKAVLESMKEVSKERQVWNSVLIPQNEIHRKLSSIWRENFKSGFIPIVKSLDEEVAKDLMEMICDTYNVMYQDYLEILNTDKFQQILDKEQKRLKKEKKKKIKILQEEILELEDTIYKYRKCIFGEKARKRKMAQKDKENLLKEIAAIEKSFPM